MRRTREGIAHGGPLCGTRVRSADRQVRFAVTATGEILRSVKLANSPHHHPLLSSQWQGPREVLLELCNADYITGPCHRYRYTRQKEWVYMGCTRDEKP